MRNVYVGLVHYPILNKNNKQVETSITNLDIHDIARSCKTFGVKRYFIINPNIAQQQFAKKILDFWQTDFAKSYNAHRALALKNVKLEKSIKSAIEEITIREKIAPIVVTTTAHTYKNQVDYSRIRKLNNPILLLFGTGFGLTKNVHLTADFVLKPIKGDCEYNHLSVRSAVAIILSNIFPEK